jgi:hypothetical protein
MKNLIHLFVLSALLLSASGCAPRETWDYLVMGVMSRAQMSDIPEQFAAHIEEEMGVTVVIHEQERWEPYEILENLRANEELRALVRNAEIITFDFNIEFLNAPGGLFSGMVCGGDDNQDCMREALAEEKENFTAIMDLLSDLRAGKPVILRVFITDDHYYQWEMPGAGVLVSPKEAEVSKVYYHEFQRFVEEEGQRRGVVIVRALPDPHFRESNPPSKWLDGLGHYTEQGSRIITDELIGHGLEFQVLK